MNKKELTRTIATYMRDKNIRKPVSSPKQIFHISDDEGNHKDFVVRKTNKSVLYTIEDVEAIIDAYVEIVSDALKHGDFVSIRGFGVLGLKYRKERSTKHPATGKAVTVGARYTPKFSPGDRLRLAAKIFELSKDDHTEPREYNEEEEDMETEQLSGTVTVSDYNGEGE